MDFGWQRSDSVLYFRRGQTNANALIGGGERQQNRWDNVKKYALEFNGKLEQVWDNVSY